MKDLTELRDMIDNVKIDPVPATIDRMLTIMAHLIDHIERIDRTAQKANNTASCLANGIQPD